MLPDQFQKLDIGIDFPQIGPPIGERRARTYEDGARSEFHWQFPLENDIPAEELGKPP
jgi:hypothetical protein